MKKLIGCNAPPSLNYGKYLNKTLELYEKEEVISYTCDFGPDNFVGFIKCGVGGWNRIPFCPEYELAGLFFF